MKENMTPVIKSRTNVSGGTRTEAEKEALRRLAIKTPLQELFFIPSIQSRVINALMLSPSFENISPRLLSRVGNACKMCFQAEPRVSFKIPPASPPLHLLLLLLLPENIFAAALGLTSEAEGERRTACPHQCGQSAALNSPPVAPSRTRHFPKAPHFSTERVQTGPSGSILVSNLVAIASRRVNKPVWLSESAELLLHKSALIFHVAWLRPEGLQRRPEIETFCMFSWATSVLTSDRSCKEEIREKRKKSWTQSLVMGLFCGIIWPVLAWKEHWWVGGWVGGGAVINQLSADKMNHHDATSERVKSG